MRKPLNMYRIARVAHKYRWGTDDDRGDNGKRKRPSSNSPTKLTVRGQGEWDFYFKMRAGLLPGDPDW